jgi:Domain of unknown function (DUF1844)
VSEDKKTETARIKVTDKRIFTADGDIREEFRKEMSPVSPAPSEKESPGTAEKAKPASARPAEPDRPEAGRRRAQTDETGNPRTPFTNFVWPLIAQTYMALGLLSNPGQNKPTLDVGAARQIIDMLAMLQQKTAGNLTEDETEFLDAHLAELKLAFVQRTKAL